MPKRAGCCGALLVLVNHNHITLEKRQTDGQMPDRCFVLSTMVTSSIIMAVNRSELLVDEMLQQVKLFMCLTAKVG